MKKLFKSVVLAGVLLTGVTTVTTGVQACSSFEELNKQGIELKYYTVTKVEKNKYTAVNPKGEKLVFTDYDTPDTIKKWNRVRAYVYKGKVTTVEVVKPKLIEYKIIKIKKVGKTNFYVGQAKNKKDGGIEFTLDYFEGKAPKVGEWVVAEFDTIYIENGLIKVTNKK